MTELNNNEIAQINGGINISRITRELGSPVVRNLPQPTVIITCPPAPVMPEIAND